MYGKRLMSGNKMPTKYHYLFFEPTYLITRTRIHFMHSITEVPKIRSEQKALILLCLSIAVATTLASTTYVSFATPENKTLMQPMGTQNMTRKLKLLMPPILVKKQNGRSEPS